MFQPPTPNIFESDSEEEQDPVSDSDSDFDPMGEIDDASEDDYPLMTNVNPEEEKQFLVSESCLAAILGRCSTCNGESQSSVLFTRGIVIRTKSVCSKGNVSQWESQTELREQYQGRVLTLGGDARCDSPGFSAKFGSYTLMDLEFGKVVDLQLVQVIMNIIISCHILSQYYKFFSG